MKMLLLVLTVPAILLSQKAGRPAASNDSGNWQLTFNDEFNGAELDLTRWSTHDPGAHVRNHRPQTYAPEALSVSGGQLHIVARSSGNEPVSGIISTFGFFAQTYGRFEIRCKVPAARGIRPRFLLLPVPLGTLPSIDVFEIAGGSPMKVSFANRWGTEQTERSFGDSLEMPELSTGFHTLAVEWERDRIRWFVDGKQKFESVDGSPHQPMFLMVDLAVEAVGGATLPASFDIDSIRVYQRPSQ